MKILDRDCLQFLLDQFGVTLENESDRESAGENGNSSESGEAESRFRAQKGYFEARQLMNQYLNYVVGHQIRLQRYIENL